MSGGDRGLTTNKLVQNVVSPHSVALMDLMERLMISCLWASLSGRLLMSFVSSGTEQSGGGEIRQEASEQPDSVRPR